MMQRIVFIVALFCVLFLAGVAVAHDSWISRGGLRNSAGEWCCGEGDCFEVDAKNVQTKPDGYHIIGKQVVNGKDATFFEVIPYSEAQPSPDGAYWRCKRPDGSRRCFFAGNHGS